MQKFGLALKEVENKIACKTVSVDEIQLVPVKASSAQVCVIGKPIEFPWVCCGKAGCSVGVACVLARCYNVH